MRGLPFVLNLSSRAGMSAAWSCASAVPYAHQPRGELHVLTDGTTFLTEIIPVSVNLCAWLCLV
jgi:hypothetical protein